MKILNKINENALLFSMNTDRKRKKSIGQFFTPKDISEYMASLILIERDNLKILDPGAGNGILACSVLQKILSYKYIKNVHVDLYENDNSIISLLKESLDYMKDIYIQNNKKLTYNIIEENFILYNSYKWKDEKYCGDYDIVISNPPYKKLRKDSLESKVMNDIIFGQPNIYFLFMAMSIKLLKDTGQFVFITPRSYFSGTYFINFRKWFISNVDIQKIVFFESRKDIFKSEKILQETTIINGVKCKKQNDYIEVVSLSNIKEHEINESISLDKNIVFERKNNYNIKIPITKEQYEALKFVDMWEEDLNSAGFKVSTGKVVDYRNRELFIDNINIRNNEVPLIWNINLKDGKFIWPLRYKNKYQLIINDNKKNLIENKNYILIRRTTSKESKKILQAVQYKKEMLKSEYIGIENHVNYLYKIDGEISETELIGLYIIFNSNIVDKYFRILCGSTQINATEINNMKFPSKFDILEIGKISYNIVDLNSEVCDKILIEYFNKYTGGD